MTVVVFSLLLVYSFSGCRLYLINDVNCYQSSYWKWEVLLQ